LEDEPLLDEKYAHRIDGKPCDVRDQVNIKTKEDSGGKTTSGFWISGR